MGLYRLSSLESISIQVTSAAEEVNIGLPIDTMKGKPRDATALEAELMRLNALVRARRQQLARLKNCPNPDCPCRVVWRNHVERGLAGQVQRIRQQVGAKRGKALRPKARARRRLAN